MPRMTALRAALAVVVVGVLLQAIFSSDTVDVTGSALAIIGVLFVLRYI